jgi:hypothetical protein
MFAGIVVPISIISDLVILFGKMDMGLIQELRDLGI